MSMPAITPLVLDQPLQDTWRDRPEIREAPDKTYDARLVSKGPTPTLYSVRQRALVLETEMRGRPVLDGTGRKIGRVDDLWVEEHSIEEAGILGPKLSLRYLEVSSGYRFRPGQQKALVPIDNVTLEASGVRIQGSRLDLFGPGG